MYSTRGRIILKFIPNFVNYTTYEIKTNKSNNIFTHLHNRSTLANSIEHLRHIVTQYENDPMYYILCNTKIIIYDNDNQDHIPIICAYEYLNIITSAIKGYLDDNKE